MRRSVQLVEHTVSREHGRTNRPPLDDPTSSLQAPTGTWIRSAKSGRTRSGIAGRGWRGEFGCYRINRYAWSKRTGIASAASSSGVSRGGDFVMRRQHVEGPRSSDGRAQRRTRPWPSRRGVRVVWLGAALALVASCSGSDGSGSNGAGGGGGGTPSIEVVGGRPEFVSGDTAVLAVYDAAGEPAGLGAATKIEIDGGAAVATFLEGESLVRLTELSPGDPQGGGHLWRYHGDCRPHRLSHRGSHVLGTPPSTPCLLDRSQRAGPTDRPELFGAPDHDLAVYRRRRLPSTVRRPDGSTPRRETCDGRRERVAIDHPHRTGRHQSFAVLDQRARSRRGRGKGRQR
jgi:hypothetical protein